MEGRIGVGFTDRHPADFVDGIDELATAVSRDAVDLEPSNLLLMKSVL